MENVEITKGQFPVKCDLTIVDSNNGLVIIVSQIPNHHGTSVTNAIETIRDSVMKTLRLDTEPAWFEHYPKGSSILGNKYTLMEVEFENGQPQWSSLVTWEKLAERLGIPAEILANGYVDEELKK